MSDFLTSYNGRMSGVLRWTQLNDIWQKLDASDGWYLYQVGAALPDAVVSEEQLAQAIADIDCFLREQHDASYCGVVYADSLSEPTLLKIYHPRKMGASCGSSGSTVLPKWTLSKRRPVDLLEWSLAKDEKPAWWKQMLKVRA